MSDPNPFESTLSALEQNLTVGLIATQSLYTCDHRQPASAALEHMRANDFSQALVKSGDASVGIVRFPSSRSGSTVADIMEPLHDWMLVSRSASLRKVITGLAREDRRFRLVVGDSSIDGIVTRSDLHKLPVRLLAFTLLTHLESLLSARVRAAYSSDEAWLYQIECGQVPEGSAGHVHSALYKAFGTDATQSIKNRAAQAKKRDAEPDLLDMADFRDKWFLVHRAHDPGDTFVSDMAAIQLFVRNTVMHSREYAPDDQALVDFDRRLSLIEKWIKRFSAD